MKAGYVAVAAAMAMGVSASGLHGRHAHEAFHNVARGGQSTAPSSNLTCGGCGSYTVWVTTYGEATLHIPPPPVTSKPAPVSTSPAPVVAPTPVATTCPTPGVYTIPETTITLTESVTVCAATSTSVPPGTHTVGGVTTVVTTSTTVVCPVAAVTTSSGITTSYIVTTTYVCPSAGTYTIAPMTTTCVESTILVYPTPATYPPGTYKQPEVVTTITETDYVVFCPFTSVGVPQPSETPASSPVMGSSGNKWAITYTPYTSSGQCKSASDVMADMVLIQSKGFTTVRLYATDCSGLQNVGAGCQATGLKMIIGVFIESSGISGAQEQVTEIVSWAQWSLVELIVIGNEAIFNGFCTPGELVDFITTCKSTFAGAGYTGPCTTTEPLNVLQEYTSLICEVVDIVGCNIHPFFNGAVDASSAGSFVASQLSIVDELCVGKSGVNLETGWPTGGLCNQAACPSPENQKTAIEGILSLAGSNSVLFSFMDDTWKAPGAFDCEQFWGVISIF